jgi:hypothetical protein
VRGLAGDAAVWRDASLLEHEDRQDHDDHEETELAGALAPFVVFAVLG